MEKQTRMNKYKDLREEMKSEVTINQHVRTMDDDDDDDFLAFLPKEEKPAIDDTLMEPLSYETLDEDNENIKMALNEAKVNVGKDQYNTRLDILNKIKKEEGRHEAVHEYRGYVKEDKSPEEQPKKMSLLEKLVAMSPEEDAEELRKFEEDMTVADMMKETKKTKKKVESPKVEKPQKKEKPRVEKQPKQEVKKAVKKKEIKQEEEVEEESKLVKFLNYVIIVFIIIFVVLAFLIVKQLLF